MITLINNLTPTHLALATTILLVGYAVHELLHVLPLRFARVDYEVRVYPWKFVSFGRFVEVVGLERMPPAVVVASSMAPLVMWAPSVVALWWVLCACSGPVLVGDLVVVGAWFVVGLPSPVDWLQTYRAITGN